MHGGALEGLRVVDLTDDLGRFATKLLAENGADVVRVAPSGPVSTGRPVDGHEGGVLEWWYDGGKRPVAVDLDTEAGRDVYRELCSTADLVVETEPPGRLAEAGIDHADLAADHPRLVQVSLTPFGRTGPRAGWAASDLTAGAMGGVLSLTGLPDAPLNTWGRQNVAFGGFTAAISALAAVRQARSVGRGSHVDLSLHEVVTGSVENLMMQYLYDDLLPMPKVAPRQGSLHWLGAYVVTPTRTKPVMVTPTPDSAGLIAWMQECGVGGLDHLAGLDPPDLVERIDELMAKLVEFAAGWDSETLWWEAQGRHIGFGEVQTVPEVAANPQFAHRGLFAAPEGTAVTRPARLARLSATPAPPPRPPGPTIDAADVGWVPRDRSAPVDAPGRPPLDGVRVLDFTWVLAGPFCTRLLGDLGAEVLKVQTEERATLVNHPDFPYYPVWNRSKQGLTLDLKHPDAVDVVRRLVEQSDVLVENYAAGVFERLGLGYETVREWNPRIVYASMSGCGHDGPWRSVLSYAPTVHALCGLTHLTNPGDRGDVGPGFSLNDHAAGFATAFEILSCLEARERSGEGQYVDLAQVEVGSYLIGPALIEWFANGDEVRPDGNADALGRAVPNEVYPAAGADEFVAVTCSTDRQWADLAALIGLDDPELATAEVRWIRRHEVDRIVGAWLARRAAAEAVAELQAAGVAAAPVQNAEDLTERDPQLRARRYWFEADTPTYGTRRYDRFPALWDGEPLAPHAPAPTYLGEANFEVYPALTDLEFDEVAEQTGTLFV